MGSTHLEGIVKGARTKAEPPRFDDSSGGVTTVGMRSKTRPWASWCENGRFNPTAKEKRGTKQRASCGQQPADASVSLVVNFLLTSLLSWFLPL
jgi:hypothetical protein